MQNFRLKLLKKFLGDWEIDSLYGPFYISPNSKLTKKLYSIETSSVLELIHLIDHLTKADIKRLSEQQHNLLDNLFQLYLIYFSLDKYRPEKSKRLFRRLLKSLDFKSDQFCGQWGTSGSPHKIAFLMNSYIKYLCLNEDWSALERFAARHFRNISSQILEEIAVILTVQLRRNPDPRIITGAIWDGGQIVTKPEGKINDLIQSNPFIYWYCKTKKRDPMALALRIFQEYDRHRKWFFNEYVAAGLGPGIRRSKSSHSLRIFDCGRGTEIQYPKCHVFAKQGIPSMGINKKIHTWKLLSDICRSPLQEFQNRIRDQYGVPRIGEGWVGEVALFRKIKQWLPRERVVHQYRAQWLGQQSIDIALPDRRLLIEYHGTQHYKPVEYFGGVEAYRNQIARDKRKSDLAKKNGFIILVFNEKDSDAKILKKIKSKILKLSQKR